MKDWEGQILIARARIMLGAPENGLAQLKKVADEPDAPGRVLVAYRSLSQQVGETELRKGLRLLDQGDRYGAYLTLQKAAQNDAHSPQADRALAQLAAERGDAAGAQAHLARYLADSPDSIQARYMAAQAALKKNDLAQASAYALKAKELAAKPADQRVDPVSDDALDRMLKRISDAYLNSVPKNPGLARNLSRLRDRIERILKARDLTPSASLDLELARYYARLGDVSSGSERALYYQKASDVLKSSESRYGANAEAAALRAKCDKRLSTLGN
jgi:hypothetical protein